MIAQILFFLLLSYALTQPAQAEWKPDNPKEFCKQHFEKPKNALGYNRKDCFKELTDGENKTLLNPTICGQACMKKANSKEQFIYCFSYCPHGKDDCVEACASKASNVYDLAHCLLDCPNWNTDCGNVCITKEEGTEGLRHCITHACPNWKKSWWTHICSKIYKKAKGFTDCLQGSNLKKPKKGCGKACFSKSKDPTKLKKCVTSCADWRKDCGEACTSISKDINELRNCIGNCPDWNEYCGEICTHKATNGTGLGICINYCPLWKKDCGQACASKAKTAQELGFCLSSACKNWKEPWAEICSNTHGAAEKFSNCLKYLNDARWKDECFQTCNSPDTSKKNKCYAACPWKNKCANQCRIDSETADEVIACVKKCK
jgi:hypothetical protein